MKRVKFMMAAIAALGASLVAQAYEATILAPNGVGDVVALTNALTEVNALSDSARSSARIWLKPGFYNLRGVYMNSASHLTISAAQHGLFAGLGAKPEDTVLLGGGEGSGTETRKGELSAGQECDPETGAARISDCLPERNHLPGRIGAPECCKCVWVYCYGGI